MSNGLDDDLKSAQILDIADNLKNRYKFITLTIAATLLAAYIGGEAIRYNAEKMILIEREKMAQQKEIEEKKINRANLEILCAIDKDACKEALKNKVKP